MGSHNCKIKSGSGLGSRLAVNKRTVFRVMRYCKMHSQAWEQDLGTRPRKEATHAHDNDINFISTGSRKAGKTAISKKPSGVSS